MGVIDWIIVCLILLFTLSGFIKGFIKGVLSTANWLLSMLAPYFLTKPFAGLLMKTGLYRGVNEKVVEWIAGKGETFTQLFNSANYQEQLRGAVSELGLPGFVGSLISGGIDAAGVPSDYTLAQVLSPSISHIIITIIASVLIILFFWLFFKIVIMLVGKLFKKGVLGLVNRLLGAALGFVKVVIIISVLMLIVSAISGIIPAFNAFLIKDLRLEAGGFGVGKYFYENNPLIKILKSVFSFDNIF